MAIFCIQCGTQLPDEAGFCYKCGKSVSAPPQLSEKEQKIRFFEALTNNDVQTVRELLEQNRSLVQSEGLRVAAIEKGSKPMTQLLLDYGVDVTTIHLGKVKSAPVAALLIQQGADVNKTDDIFLVTPLHEAAENDRLNIAKLLLDNGARVNAQNDLGYTPLHKAADGFFFEMVKLLVERGADVNMVARYPKVTPLMSVWHIKDNSQAQAITAFLLSRGAKGFGSPNRPIYEY